jgi:hypothetical protein
MHFWGKVIRQEDRKNVFLELWEGIRFFSLKGAAMFLINCLAAYVVYISVIFYKSHSSNVFFAVLRGIGIWFAFTYLLMQIFLFPIMVLDEKRRMLISYKKSLIMLVSAPFSSIGILAVISYLMILLWPLVFGIGGPQANGFLAGFMLFPVFLMPFLSLMFIMILQLNCAILIYEKHKIMPDLKEAWEEKKWSNLFRPWEVK